MAPHILNLDTDVSLVSVGRQNGVLSSGKFNTDVFLCVIFKFIEKESTVEERSLFALNFLFVFMKYVA